MSRVYNLNPECEHENGCPPPHCTFCDEPAVKMRAYSRFSEAHPRVVKWCANHLPVSERTGEEKP